MRIENKITKTAENKKMALVWKSVAAKTLLNCSEGGLTCHYVVAFINLTKFEYTHLSSVSQIIWDIIYACITKVSHRGLFISLTTSMRWWGGDDAVQIHCETPMCPWARHLTPSCSRGVRPMTYLAIVSRFG